MSVRLITRDIWRTIAARVRKHPRSCSVAVAYFGASGATILPLGKGSLLVVDCSPRAVTSGQTKPSELLKLMQRGVEVHSVQNLHAKVFVVSNRAFIGSTNVSSYSANRLIEATLETSDSRIVAGCRQFVRDLSGERITPKHARQLAKIYRSPRFGGGRPRAQTLTKQVTPSHAPVWAVPLRIEKWDKLDEAQGRQGKPLAKKRMRGGRSSQIDEFLWEGKAFLTSLELGDIVISVTQIPSGDCMVSEAARVVYARYYQAEKQRRAVVFLETRKGARRRHIDRVVAKFGRAAAPLTGLTDPVRLRDKDFIHRLLNLSK
jgi:hypothetical protein